MRSDIKMLSLGDTHCGHRGGLTIPEYMMAVTPDMSPRNRGIAEAQRQIWQWYLDEIVSRGPYDVLVLGGDLVDGKQRKSDGDDLWSTKRLDQQDCAIKALRRLVRKNRTKVFGVMGSRYHTEGDWEAEVMEALGAEIAHHEPLEIGGTVFDIKHKVGCGGAPSSRPGVRNEWLHSLIWSAHDDGPRADVVVRHHAHTYWHEGDGAYLGIVVPGLQWFSDFGQLNVSRWIGIGCVEFNVNPQQKGLPQWAARIAKLDALKVRAKHVS